MRFHNKNSLFSRVHLPFTKCCKSSIIELLFSSFSFYEMQRKFKFFQQSSFSFNEMERNIISVYSAGFKFFPFPTKKLVEVSIWICTIRNNSIQFKRSSACRKFSLLSRLAVQNFCQNLAFRNSVFSYSAYSAKKNKQMTSSSSCVYGFSFHKVYKIV